jgi:hypothetical protein
MFRDLLNVSSLRGVEGSGVIVYQKGTYLHKPAVRTIRSKYISGILAYSDGLDELLKPSCSALIGHARWPTKGGTDEKALHPHRYGHIIGVHNGTLHKVGGEDVPDGQSDSAMLFKSFAEKGVKETMKDTRGAYAFVWVDEKEGTLNFLRNYQRPLVFKNIGWQGKNIQTLFWASEPEMLDFVFKRSYKGQNTWDTYLPAHKWYKYPLACGNIIRPVEVVDCEPDPIVRPPQTNTGYRGRGRWENGRMVWSDATQDWEEDFVRGHGGNSSNILALPGPRRDADLPPTTRDGPVSSPSKNQIKRAAKAAAREEAKARRQREAAAIREAAEKSRPFRYVRPEDRCEAADTSTDDVAEVVPVRQQGNMNEVMAELNRRSAQVTALSELWDDVTDVACYGTASLAGQFCCSCGTEASVGDKVFLAGSDVGRKTDFICWDCGSGSSWADITRNTSPTTVTN